MYIYSLCGWLIRPRKIHRIAKRNKIWNHCTIFSFTKSNLFYCFIFVVCINDGNGHWIKNIPLLCFKHFHISFLDLATA